MQASSRLIRRPRQAFALQLEARLSGRPDQQKRVPSSAFEAGADLMVDWQWNMSFGENGFHKA